MNFETKKKLNRYYHEIRKELSCSIILKNNFINDIKQNINEIDLDNPDITYDEIVTLLGTPKQISLSFYKQNLNALIRTNKILKIIKYLSLTVFIIVILMILYVYFRYGGSALVRCLPK